MRTQKTMVVSTALLWLLLVTCASGYRHGMDMEDHHYHHHHHGYHGNGEMKTATVMLMGHEGGPQKKVPDAAVDIIVNGPLWALGRKGGPFVVESVHVGTTGQEKFPRKMDMPIIHQRMVRCPGFMRRVEHMMDGPMGGSMESPRDMMLRLVESIPLLQEELDTRYSEVITQHHAHHQEAEPASWWNVHKRCMNTMKEHVSSWWQSAESRITNWSSNLRSADGEADSIEWNLWDEEGNLNIGLIIFVGLIGLSTAVWSLLMLQLVQFMRRRCSSEYEEQFVFNNNNKVVEHPPVKQAMKGDIVQS